MKILVVNVNWLGDCVMTLPVFKALKEKFPESSIGVMAVPRVRDLFVNNPYIDEVIIFDEKTIHKNLAAKLIFIRNLRSANYDTVYFIHRSFTRAVICLAAGIRQRIGFQRKKTSWVITDKAFPPGEDMPRADQYFSLFEQSGIPVRDRVPVFPLKEEERQKGEKYLEIFKNKYSRLVAVNPAANWEQKRWPIKHFISLISNLCSQNNAVFIVGTEKEKHFAEDIASAVPEGVYDLCGKTDIRELAALLSGMDCLVSADSGPAHLAASLGIPVLVLFGPTDPAITAPRGKGVKIIKNKVSCTIPCYYLDCRNNICMQGLSPDLVLKEVNTILDHG